MTWRLIDGIIANDAFASPVSAGVSSLVDGINNQQFSTPASATNQPVDGALLLSTWTSSISGIAASLNWTEASETFLANINLTDNISAAWTDGTENQALVVNLLDNAIISYTELSETFSLSVSLTDNAALSWTEQSETVSINVVLSIPVTITASWTELSDTMALTGIVGAISSPTMPYNIPLPPLAASFRRATSTSQYKH